MDFLYMFQILSLLILNHIYMNMILILAANAIALCGAALAWESPSRFGVCSHLNRWEFPVVDQQLPIMKKAGIKYRIAKGGDTGKVLETLGFAGDSSIKAAEFAEAVNKSGAKVLVTPSPAVYDSLTNDLSSHGIKLIPKVMHVSEFLAQIKIKFAKKAGKV